MKTMMSTHSMVFSPTTSPTTLKRETSSISSSSSSSRLRVQNDTGGRRSGMDSEDDWTGTGDDWTGTGASSDSGFINFIRNRPENGYLPGLKGHLPHSPCNTPAPPVPPKGPLTPPIQDGEDDYMNLTSSTMDKDSQYVTINRQELLAMDQDNQYVTINRQELLAMRDVEFKQGGQMCTYQRPHLASSTTLPGQTVTSLSTDELTNSFTDEDGYCRMVPQRVVGRNMSLPSIRPPPVPPHKNSGIPPPQGVYVHSAGGGSRTGL